MYYPFKTFRRFLFALYSTQIDFQMYLNGISNDAFLSNDMLNCIMDISNWIADTSNHIQISLIELQTSLKSACQTVL